MVGDLVGEAESEKLGKLGVKEGETLGSKDGGRIVGEGEGVWSVKVGFREGS